MGPFSSTPYYMHSLALDFFFRCLCAVHLLKVGQGFASRGWSLDVLIVLEKSPTSIF